MAEGLIQYKGKWIEINQEKLSQALEAFEKISDMPENSEAMKFELSLQNQLSNISDELDISVSNINDTIIMYKKVHLKMYKY